VTRIGEPVASEPGRRPIQHHLGIVFPLKTVSDKTNAACALSPAQAGITRTESTQSMTQDTTTATILKVETDPDTKSIAGYLDAVLRDNEPREFRFIHGRTGKVKNLWWNPDIPHSKVVEWIRTDQAFGYNIYIAINPNREGTAAAKMAGKGCEDVDISSRVWIPIDCDPKRAAGTLATADERSAAELISSEILDWYRSNFPDHAEPVHGCSGSGFQILIPCELAADEVSDKAVKDLLKMLAKTFDNDFAKVDTVVSNRSRIMRVLGSLAFYKKTDHPGRGWLVSSGTAGKPLKLSDIESVATCSEPPKPSGKAGKPKIEPWIGTPLSYFEMKVRAVAKKLFSVPAGELHVAHRDHVFLLAGYAKTLSLLDQRNFVYETEMAAVTANPACVDAELAAKTFNDAWAAGIAKPVPESDLPPFDLPPPPVPPVVVKGSGTEVDSLRCADTDGGRGRLLGEFLTGKARYVHEWSESGWLWWDGGRWNRSTPTVYQAAKKWLPSAIASRFGDYKAAKEADDRKSISNALWWCSTDPQIGLPVSDIDNNGWLFNCQNGTLDLETMTFRPANPDDRITKISSTAYDPNAKCPQFMATLEYFIPDESVRDMVQMHAGSALVGVVTHLKLPILYGQGNNGKSTIIVALMDAFGKDYACMLDAEILTATGQNSRSDSMYHVADLHGKRLVIINELEESATLKTSALKKIISSDPVKARRPREMPFDFVPSYKAFLLTNHRPKLRTVDNGTMRRLALVPFDVTIDPAKDVKNFNRILQAEVSGILNWLIEGCMKWKSAGMKIDIPAAVVAATDSYASDEDQIGQFFSACVTKARGGYVTGKMMFDTYRQWCESSGYEPATLTAFGRRVQQAYVGKRSMGGMTYQNIVAKFEPEY
jgi:putative DNA primase/helicase